MSCGALWDVREGTGAVATFKLRDAAVPPAVLTLAQILTLTLTLYDETTGAIVHARDHQNVLNASDVVVASNGTITWALQADDNQLLDPSLTWERHVALWEWTYGSPAIPGSAEMIFRVMNVRKV